MARMPFRQFLIIPLLPYLLLGLPAAGWAAQTIRGSLTGQVTIKGQRTPEVRDVVVAVQGVPPALFSETPQRLPTDTQIEQRNKTFIPHVLPVLAGTTVSFPNNDPIFHNVFSDSATHKFDLGLYKAGQSRSTRFDKTGVVEVRCNVHNLMSAYVVVEPTPYFTTPNERGIYQIGEVPSGRYTVTAWNPRLGTITRALSIESSGEVVELNFDFGSEH